MHLFERTFFTVENGLLKGERDRDRKGRKKVNTD